MNAAATFQPRYRFMGINDNESTCVCCGKKGLKRVVWLLDLDGDDDALHYGTTCAAHLLSRSSGDKPTVAQAEKILLAAQQDEDLRVARAEVARVRALPVPMIEVDHTVDALGRIRVTCGDAKVFAFVTPGTDHATQQWNARSLSEARQNAVEKWQRKQAAEGISIVAWAAASKEP